jgi:hypothetical protein
VLHRPSELAPDIGSKRWKQKRELKIDENEESPVFMGFFAHLAEKAELREKAWGIIPPSPPLPAQ